MINEFVITLAVATCVVLVMAKLFFKSSAILIKLIINSLLGAVFLYFFNLICQNLFSFSIALNSVTATICGVLGIPGLLLLIAVKCFLPL